MTLDALLGLDVQSLSTLLPGILNVLSKPIPVSLRVC